MDTPEPFPYSRQVEGLCEDAAPRGMTAESDRPIPWQTAVFGHKISTLEALYHDLAERMVKVEEKMRAFPGDVTQKELQEKEEYKKLKEKNKELEAKNKELLAKAMGMHKNSENMNDPSRLSAVLATYEMLRLCDWEQFRTSTNPFLTYKTGSRIIQKLFDACEEDVHQRIKNILEVLGIPPLNDAMTGSKEGVMEQIRSLLRYSYNQKNSQLVSKIVTQTGIVFETARQRQFMEQCCQVYCLLRLQDTPVKAVWNLQKSLLQYLEHVDKKDREHWRKPKFLWPIMKCGEQVIVKGVVWDEE